MLFNQILRLTHFLFRNLRIFLLRALHTKNVTYTFQKKMQLRLFVKKKTAIRDLHQRTKKSLPYSEVLEIPQTAGVM